MTTDNNTAGTAQAAAAGNGANSTPQAQTAAEQSQAADGGQKPAAEQSQAADGGQKPAADPAAGKTYTEAQLAELREQWRREDEQARAAQKDFEKMTPEQKAQKLLDDQKAETARLQAELADRDLTDYARGKLTDAKLPADALPFVKGKDQADTDAKITAFGAMLAAGVQAGVEARFKANGYTPRGTAATNSGEGGEKKPRGVTVNPGK